MGVLKLNVGLFYSFSEISIQAGMCLYSSIGLVFCCFGLLGNLELNLRFCTFIFHKLSRQSPPLQVVNGEWMTSSTVTESPKSESETRKRESGVLLPTFKTSRDKDDFKNYSGSSRFCPPLLLQRPQVPPYWGHTTSSISWDIFLSKGTSSSPGLEDDDDEQWCCSWFPRHWSSRPCGWVGCNLTEFTLTF